MEEGKKDREKEGRKFEGRRELEGGREREGGRGREREVRERGSCPET